MLVLNRKLNETYIPYGEKGAVSQFNLILQDNNSAGYGNANMADRAAFKSSRAYSAIDWDLVDAYAKDKNVIEDVEVSIDTLQVLDVADLEKEIMKYAAQRKKIQAEISELETKRRAYKLNHTPESADQSLQQKIIQTIKKQAKSRGFEVLD